MREEFLRTDKQRFWPIGEECPRPYKQRLGPMGEEFLHFKLQCLFFNLPWSVFILKMDPYPFGFKILILPVCSMYLVPWDIFWLWYTRKVARFAGLFYILRRVAAFSSISLVLLAHPDKLCKKWCGKFCGLLAFISIDNCPPVGWDPQATFFSHNFYSRKFRLFWEKS